LQGAEYVGAELALLAFRLGQGARIQRLDLTHADHLLFHLLEQGVKRPLIVTDRALAQLPVMAEFRSHLQQKHGIAGTLSLPRADIA
jgi:hypothetical protein